MRERLAGRQPFDYQVERTNDRWPEHTLRTTVTAGAIEWLRPRTVLDPACGDGSIVLTAHKLRPIDYASLSDISVPSIEAIALPDGYGWIKDVQPIELELERINIGKPVWDVIVLTEILEHVEDPVAILKAARLVARNIVASSPEMRPGQHDPNPEHLWQFDGDGFYEMLVEAGWPEIGTKIHLRFDSQYNFGIWVAHQ